MNPLQESVLTLLVYNSFGVLSKVTGLFSRRGYNIKSLSVGETEDPLVSRITIVTDGDAGRQEQVYRQVLKLEDVKTAALLPMDTLVERELVLVKVRPDNSQFAQLAALAERWSAKSTEVLGGCVILEATGPTGDIDALVEGARPLNIVEISRTGITCLQKSGDALQNVQI